MINESKTVEYHVPIMCNEIIDYMISKPKGTYLDGTLGGGGHSRAILDNIDSDGRLYSIDRDIEAINHNKMNLAQYKNFHAIHGNFHNAKNILKDINIMSIDGALLDLGVSSHQLDTPERGFSYNTDALLDMRMGEDCNQSASDYINTVDEKTLTQVLYDYGDEKWAARIAKKTVEFRIKSRIETTFDLVGIIDSAIPKAVRRKINGHPAKRTFQAIRIAINNEIEPLEAAIRDIVSILNDDSNFCILTFHSIEDRIVKHTFRKLENPCICSPKAPICTCGKVSLGKVLKKAPFKVSVEEFESNSRSHSAKLRIFKRIINN